MPELIYKTEIDQQADKGEKNTLQLPKGLEGR